MFFHKSKRFSHRTMSDLAIDWPAFVGRIPDATREIPARLGVTPQTVSNWLEGRVKPEADNVVKMLAAFDEFADALLERANRKQGGLSFEQKRALLKVIGEG